MEAPHPPRIAVSAVWTGGLAAIAAIVLLIPPILLARGAPSLDWALARTLYLILAGIPVGVLVFVIVAVTMLPAAFLLERAGAFRPPAVVAVGAVIWLGISLLDPTWPWWWGLLVGAATGGGFVAGVLRADFANEPSKGAIPGIFGPGVSRPPDREVAPDPDRPPTFMELGWGVLTSGTVLLGLAVFFLVVAANDSNDPHALLGLISFGVVVGVPAVVGAYVAVAAVFIPVHLLTRRFGVLRLAALAVTGFVAPMILVAVWSPDDLPRGLIGLSQMVSALSAFGFWAGTLIARPVHRKLRPPLPPGFPQGEDA